ncbi:MAG: endonuclease/exonuclease/phosphatase family protein [Pseudomonadota bacterium]
MKIYRYVKPLILLVFALTLFPLSASADGHTIRIVTWNLEWFYDNNTRDDNSTIGRDFAAPNGREYNGRVIAVAEAVAEMQPTILALQEVENAKVVADIAVELADEHGLAYEVAFVEGKDSYTGQDVAFLVEEGLLFEASRYRFPSAFRSRGYKDISKHLKLEVLVGDETITLISVHLITSQDNRELQALTLRGWVENTVASENIVILGDFNTRQRFNQTTPDSEMGIIRGFQTDDESDDFFDAHQILNDRSTHVSGSELDRILLSPGLLDETGYQLTEANVRGDLAIRGSEDRSDGVDYDQPAAEQDISDHYPVIVTLTIPGFETATDDADTAVSTDEDSLRQELLDALAQVESELQKLNEELETIRGLIEALDE